MGTDIVVIGGGVIGLSIAWHLLAAGARVVVIDSGEPAAASSASAGMLAPLTEASQASPLLDLGVVSLRAYPAFLDALADATGQRVMLCGPGMLRLGRHDVVVQQARARGMAVETLDRDALRGLEPRLARDLDAAVFTPEEKHVDPRELMAALKAAIRLRGATAIHGAARELLMEGDSVCAVRTAERTIACGSVIIAAGAWSDTISRLGVAFGTHPVRGQIVVLRPSAIQCTIYGTGAYLVPRGSHLLVGATQERVGFDARVTAEGVTALLNAALAIVPSLRDSEMVTAWAGLRPGSPDGMPVIGRVTGAPNAFVATGHFRNGILLAPITGSLVAEMVSSGKVPELLQAFTLDRFAVHA